MPRALCPFNWFGGKASLLPHLLPVLAAAPHTRYVEPFGGSAAVLLNKEPSPVEIYNDAHGEVVNFFRVLRADGDELIRAIELTPYSREEFGEALGESADPVERARRFFTVARQVTMGLATTATPGRWCVAGNQSRRGMALVVSRWLSSVDRLPEVVARLRQVVIENADGLEVVKKYDGPDTLHYVDPPYPMATRSGGTAYAHEFDRHEELLDLLAECRGRVAVSSYPNGLYDGRLRDWNRREIRAGSHTARFHKGAELSRVEVVWTNY